MKIQCDVCEKHEAAVFCGADEAALCENCDERVHHANKLASKHQRFSILNPSFKETPPQCDICQERKAVLFCKEDRAILCRECDIPIHIANEHTKKHNRFLLTGVKLSSSSAIYPTSSSSSSNEQSQKMSSGSDVKIPNRGYVTAVSCGKFNDDMKIMQSNGGGVTTPTYCQTSEEGSISTSDYMMDSDGGWKLEDLIDASSSGSQFFSKTFDYEMPTAEHWYHNEIVQNNMGSFPSQDLKMWTTQGLTPDYPIFLPTM